MTPLINGLLYSSESEFPWILDDLGNKKLEEIQVLISARHNHEAAVEVEADSFFTRYIQNRIIGGNEVSLAEAGRYTQLHHFLKTNAAAISVWRCGRIQVGIYILITTKKGQTLMLRTTAIET
ncbi:MAG: hypothetical protein IPL84_00665 [Chitinophagaceae bacterium]|nr:hypothetical protein [Chitinophagaceae bacterium]